MVPFVCSGNSSLYNDIAKEFAEFEIKVDAIKLVTGGSQQKLILYRRTPETLG